jgi:hypothetical protein
MRRKKQNEIVSDWLFEGGKRDVICELKIVNCSKELRMRTKRDNEIVGAWLFEG